MHDSDPTTDDRTEPAPNDRTDSTTDDRIETTPDNDIGDASSGALNRRRFIAASMAAGIAGVAGCTELPGSGGDGESPDQSGALQIGSGRAPDDLGGTSVDDLPDLEGELHVYSGRNEFLVGELIDALEGWYDDFSVTTRYAGSADLVNSIVTEGEGTPADVFYSVNAGSLAALAEEGRTQSLSDSIQDRVREELRTDQWVGTSGRARTVPYNTNALSASDLPENIMEFPTDAEYGWAPTYGSCQAFITAMRLLEGEDATQDWLEAVVDANITVFNDELAVCQAIANGEIDAGFTNHYYIQRVRDGNEDPPIATTFTSGDAGAVFNVAGAAVVDQADDPELAQNFVEHLLSREVQNYFATSTFEYPLVEGVPPIGDLPSIEDLEVPDVDLSRLSELEETVDLMRDAGVDV